MDRAGGGRYLIRRSVAYTIDAALTCAVLMSTMLVLLVAVLVSPSPDELSPAGAILVAASFLVAVPLGFGFFLARDGLRGGSPGKRICGLHVVDARTGERCRMVQSLVRNLVLLAVGAADLLVPFFRADGRRIGDLAAGTLVVRKG